MAGASTQLLAWGLVMLTGAGCLGGSHPRYLEGPFSLDAPTWVAGDAWAYELKERFSSEHRRSDGVVDVSESGDLPSYLSVEVFNTTKTVRDEPVYYAWTQSRGQYPVANDPAARKALLVAVQKGEARALTVYRQSDFGVIGQGAGSSYEVIDFAPSGAKPFGQVYGGGWVEFDESLNPLPQFQFPLRTDQAWAPVREGGIPMEFSARVVGRQRVPWDGTDPMAVHVRVVGTVRPDRINAVVESMDVLPPQHDQYEFSAVLYGEYWWGIKERNLLLAVERTEVSYEGRGPGPSGEEIEVRGRSTQVRERRLVEAWLGSGKEFPLPVELVSPLDEEQGRVRQLRIARGGPLVYDVGEGPIVVQAFLADPWSVQACTFDSEMARDCDRPATDVDAARFQVEWVLSTSTGAPVYSEIERALGPEFIFTIGTPGWYRLEASVTDLDYGTVIQETSDAFGVSWTGEGLVDLPPTVMVPSYNYAPVTVLTFNTPLAGAHLRLDYALRRGAPYVSPGGDALDEGFFRLVGPYEQARDLWDQEFTYVLTLEEAGPYRVEWWPQSVVVMGDDPWAAAELTYPSNYFWYH